MREASRIAGRITGLALVILIAAFVGTRLANTQAQTAAPPVFQYVAGTLTHTACLPTTGATTFCLVADGAWISVNGGAFTQIGAPVAAGVTSVTVCDATAANCGTAQTGAVSLNIPKTATISTPTATLK